jgi:hypothetical protein
MRSRVMAAIPLNFIEKGNHRMIVRTTVMKNKKKTAGGGGEYHRKKDDRNIYTRPFHTTKIV